MSETERTKRLAEELREHPRLREQVEAILKLVRSAEGPIGRADDVEKLLIPEVRKLGQTAMQEWALGAEERSAAQLQRDSPGAHCLKKKP